jgi:hypothetical protein
LPNLQIDTEGPEIHNLENRIYKEVKKDHALNHHFTSLPYMGLEWVLGWEVDGWDK